MFQLTNLLSFLEKEGAPPRKSLSQNFLVDGNIVKKILRIADLHPHDTVLEIGPGAGVFTEELLNCGVRVLAVETDEKLAEALKRLQTSDQRLSVYKEDALKIELSTLLDDASFSCKKKLISNLPYHIAIPLILRFLPLYTKITSLTFIVQKEVAERLTAKPGSKKAGSISLLIRLLSDPSLQFHIPPSCFYPRPNVASSVVHLLLKPPPLGIDIRKFEKLIRTSFGQRRKMLRSSLKDLGPQEVLMNAFKEAQISPTSRPETITLEQFIAFYFSVHPLL